MSNLNYCRAAEYERGVAKHLLTNGALYATRTPGSRSPIDVIAVFPAKVKLALPFIHMIQCKLGKSRPKRSEIDFLKFMREKGCEVYFMTRQAGIRGKKKQITFMKVTLEEVEEGKLGPIKENGLTESDERANESRKNLKKPTKKKRMSEEDLGSPIPTYKMRNRR